MVNSLTTYNTVQYSMPTIVLKLKLFALKLRQCRDVMTPKSVSSMVTVVVTRHTNDQIEVHCYGNKFSSEICYGCKSDYNDGVIFTMFQLITIPQSH